METIEANVPGPPSSEEFLDGFVKVRGAQENNLKNVDVDVPRDSIVAFTGISGSGKSSLAFGTIFAEAQRRYFESVAPYARRLIQQGGNPHVESITGLPPAVALQQRRGTPSTRSSVGTVTTLSNSLRMLFSRAGDYPDGAGILYSDVFSPNTVTGACPVCHGLGTAHTVTEGLLVPDPELSISDGAVAAWPGAWQGKNLRDILVKLGYDVYVPWKTLPQEQRDWILFTEEQPVVTVTPLRDRIEKPYKGKFWSARSHVLHTLSESKSASMRERALTFMHAGPCPECGGSGLKAEALAVSVAGRNIAEMNLLPLKEYKDVLGPLCNVPAGSEGSREAVGAAIAKDLLHRIGVLLDLGLGYLSLGRGTPTLSPGEMQRLRIATQLRSGLFGVIYVLDEPSAGLHPADTEPLMEVLAQLRAAGNTVFVVEHNMDLVRNADWIVDVGPRAGVDGGRILYSGPVQGLADAQESLTRPFLLEGVSPASPLESTNGDATGSARQTGHSARQERGRLEVRHASLHNLQDLEVSVPVGVLSAVTGVSGSGKSSLLKILSEAFESRDAADGAPSTVTGAAGATVSGLDAVDRLVEVDQRPIGRTPRSNLATYTGLFDAVRREFAATAGARKRGFSPSRFSFNVAGGRCENCLGEGSVSVELLFLPGSYGPCPVCHGARFNEETLEVEYHGKNIAQVLALTVDAAATFLADIPAAARSLAALREVGLGYLRLGQPATELSGGEAQRIKLATELQRARKGHTLYLLDEPTTGLHPADVRLLLHQLNRLVDTGNTVVVVEHDMDVVASADWVVDLGPSGGADGGRLMAAGTPEEVAATAGSRTAPYLAVATAKR
ncbi:excinuclease ABC subunit UvrA [Arthrobacter sp. H35-D1]|uniref:excinuclease ABC subunit UvrA n=1 Tax=Arthrobacter sp. H35-D1 TaxID=3046202 RepID=UPI0024BA9C28|nr:excinuclease ABC subunit UvrA [Arthrobacter sp. H35-D1]MDJ0315313.1 excinuclease ABC subunit UvrA [Arthrobacter sp. H35-D1]